MSDTKQTSAGTYLKCHSGVTGLPLDHEAEGWIVSPEGRRISAMCSEHAHEVIGEYRDKLSEEWTFEVAA